MVPQELEDSFEMKKKLVPRTKRQSGDKKSWYQELEDSLGDEKMRVSRTRRQPGDEKSQY